MAGGVGTRGEAGPAKRLPRALRPDRCRQYARKELARGLPGILQTFIDEAQKGSIPHAKALMSLAGLDKEDGVPAAQGKKPNGLSEMLLRELRRRPGAQTDNAKRPAGMMRDVSLREEST